MEERIIKYRRDLHQIPELDRTLPETLSYVRQVLEPLGCTLFSPAEGALCAWFDAGTIDSLADASAFMRKAEAQAGKKISVPEEIALNNGWLDRQKIAKTAEKYEKSDYGRYLRRLIGEF